MSIFYEWKLCTDENGKKYALNCSLNSKVYVKKMTLDETKARFSYFGFRTIGSLVYFEVGREDRLGILKEIYRRADGTDGHWGCVKCLGSGKMYLDGLFTFQSVDPSSISTLQLAIFKTLEYRADKKNEKA